jgi:hypothetical protein
MLSDDTEHQHTPDEEREIREAALDQTIEGSFPASESPARPFYGKLPVSSLNIRRTVVSRCAEKFGIFSYCWSFTAATA